MRPQNQPNWGKADQEDIKAKGGEKTCDADLLKSWYEGSYTACEQLFYKYYPKALSYAMCLCKNRADSEDLVQRTFLNIYEKVDSKNGEPISAFRAYLFRAIDQNHIDRKRKKSSRYEQPWGSQIGEIPEPASQDQQVENFHQDNMVETILGLIENQDQRKTYKQSLEGYSYEEIAKMNNLSKGQVRGLTARARRSLRSLKCVVARIISGKNNKDGKICSSSK